MRRQPDAMHTRPQPGVVPVSDLRRAVLGATSSLGQLAARTEEALADEVIDAGERVALERDLDDLARRVEEVRARVRQAPAPLRRASGR